MLRRQRAGLIVPTLTFLSVIFAHSLYSACPQEGVNDRRPAREVAAGDVGSPAMSAQVDEKKVEAEIEKMIATYDLTPLPLAPIPDNPAPHEGAMIHLTHVVEPPDLVLVEVLEALPGRPISGERLVRPDGKIGLGFYGDVEVAGMTAHQVKVAIIKHLRIFLTDDVLGLRLHDTYNMDEMPYPPPPSPGASDSPEVPAGLEPFEPRKPSLRAQPSPRPVLPRPPETSRSSGNPTGSDGMKPRSSSYRSRPARRAVNGRSVSRPIVGAAVPVRPVRTQSVLDQALDEAKPAQTSNQVKIPAGAKGRITITIDVDGQAASTAEQNQAAPPTPSADDIRRMIVPPEKDAMVFVDVTAFNSKNYYVLGDVLITGKLPWTGNETVLDALQFAGGLLPTAEPKDIHVVRPPRGGKPAKVYKVDLDAIQNRGDVTTNYQIFPNDRLVVGRNDVAKKTTEIDRLNAPIQSIAGTITQEAGMLRALQLATAENREELLKEYVDFWSKELSRPGGVKFDEQTLREALIRKLKLTPVPATTTPAPR
jgi:protein involved in polysaccharide export with SLBB domain